jgi:hypothetical protein
VARSWKITPLRACGIVVVATLVAAAPRVSLGQDTNAPPAASASASASSSASAPPPIDDTAARAAALKQSGDDAMDSLSYDDALAAYRAAYALSADPRLLYNMGQVYRARGQYPDALEHLERFDRDAPAGLKQLVPKLAELLAEVRGKVATLTVTCNVPGARVVVRDQIVGTTPLAAPLKLNAGDAVVDVSADGYFPFHASARLPGGGQSLIDASLLPKATSGVLVVRTAGGSGAVFVDGKSFGDAPIEAIVGAGTHDIVVRRESFEDARTSAVVVAGQRREVDLDLAEKPAITTRWWFWTGIGVAVLGGVALTYALLTEKKAGSGDQFQPGQVSGPLVRW